MAFGGNNRGGNNYSGAGRGNAGRPATSAPKAEGGSMPTHLLKMKSGEGDEGKFITLTGLFMSGGQDGKVEFLKGKTRSIVSVKLDDGTELSGNQFFVFPRDDK